jgi:hypothetical protein
MKHGLNTDVKSTAFVGSQKILFDVPVYRLSREKYELQQTKFIERELKNSGGRYWEEACRRSPELKVQAEGHLWNIYGGSWLYNEIIGFIRLFFLSEQIRGEYYRVEAKKIIRTRRKVFRPLASEVTSPEKVSLGSSNQEIFGKIRNYLLRVQNEKELKKHYIDASVLENVGLHIDWSALLKEQFVKRTK